MERACSCGPQRAVTGAKLQCVKVTCNPDRLVVVFTKPSTYNRNFHVEGPWETDEFDMDFHPR